MKKIISIALAAIMLVALAVPAFAAEAITSGISGGTTGNVEVIINEKDDPSTPGDEGTTYSVNIGWNSLKFTYTGTWDAEELAYTGTWDKNNETIVVTNSSNAAVDVDAHFGDTKGTVTSEANGVTATLSTYDFRLNSAADAGQATSNTITVSVTGAPKVSTGFTVGTITVALSTVD